jgi:hypothetical protein
MISSVPTPADGTLVGALPANEKAALVVAGAASEDRSAAMISTTKRPDDARDDDKTSASPPSGSATQGTSLAPVSIPPLALEALLAVDLTAFATDDLGNLREAILDARTEVSQRYGMVLDRIKEEATARIKASGGRALPSFEFEKFELEDEFTQYAFDDAKLEAAMALVSEADARKIGCVIPEHTEVVARRFVRGNTAAILALIRKYGEGSEIGKALSGAMSRSKTGERLVIKRAAPEAELLAGRR